MMMMMTAVLNGLELIRILRVPFSYKLLECILRSSSQHSPASISVNRLAKTVPVVIPYDYAARSRKLKGLQKEGEQNCCGEYQKKKSLIKVAHKETSRPGTIALGHRNNMTFNLLRETDRNRPKNGCLNSKCQAGTRP